MVVHILPYYNSTGLACEVLCHEGFRAVWTRGAEVPSLYGELEGQKRNCFSEWEKFFQSTSVYLNEVSVPARMGLDRLPTDRL